YAVATRDLLDRAYQHIRCGVASAEQTTDADLSGADHGAVVDRAHHQDRVRHPSLLERAQNTLGFVIQHVSDCDADVDTVEVTGFHHADLGAHAQLADHPRLQNRIVGVDVCGYSSLHSIPPRSNWFVGERLSGCSSTPAQRRSRDFSTNAQRA